MKLLPKCIPADGALALLVHIGIFALHIIDDASISQMLVVLLLKFIEQKPDVHADHQRRHGKPQIAREQHMQMVNQIERVKGTTENDIVVMEPSELLP